jgi:threonine dehydrogenase-like Zn-dependent dehydrogenase
MNLIDTFQDLVAHVPELLQPLIVALAGAVPFIDGEGAAGIGILGGIHPVVAVVAGIIGNFACVAILVLAGSGARQAVVTRRRNRREARVPATVGAGAAVESSEPADGSEPVVDTSPRKARFQRAFERYGVPGVSLLGPLLLPSQFTATMLAGAGVGAPRILVWQGVAIVLWTTLVAVVLGSGVSALH